MYIFSDMINLFKTYEEENCGKTTIKEVISDYVERSYGFRHFLHSVTEILMKDHKCSVPFHHGTYFDAAEMEFSGFVEEVISIFCDGVMTYYQRKKEEQKSHLRSFFGTLFIFLLSERITRHLRILTICSYKQLLFSQ